MKHLKKVGKDDPKGWEQPQDAAFPIIPEPENENELPVPYYDSDDYDDESDTTHDENYGDTDTDYSSDAGSVHRSRKDRVYHPIPTVHNNYKTVVKEETDFIDE